MDTIVKVTIGLFLFAILLLFFKATKNLSEGYMDAHITSYEHVDNLMNNDTHHYNENDLDSYNTAIPYLDAGLDPNDIIWKVNG